MADTAELPYEVGSRTDTGLVRDENQDALGHFRTNDGQWRLLLVCDGLGGHAGGQTASALAVETIGRCFAARVTDGDALAALRAAVQEANAAVFATAQAQPDLRGMATTCAALAVRGAEAFLAHVGDSRIYRIRPGAMERLTRDHSAVQQMVDDGRISEQEARGHPEGNLLSRCVGGEETVEPELRGPELVAAGDRFVLCTDGLSALVEDELIAALAVMYPTEEAVDKLVALARSRGGHDNISVHLLYRADGHPPTGKFEPERYRPPHEAEPPPVVAAEAEAAPAVTCACPLPWYTRWRGAALVALGMGLGLALAFGWVKCNGGS